ncbi:N-6 DNA methylase [Nocardia fluminea]|uniref:N-6 DNA methylase n=1 Tax=Nocardia fluminea TaxID=134984 RepID=UPI0033F5697D
MSFDEPDALTAAAIARLAGVGRAAVSNWRKRYPDFPQPNSGTSASPTFSRAEVEAWLTATGKGEQLATAGRTDTGTHLLDAPEPETVEETRLSPEQLLARAIASLLPRATAAQQPVNIADVEVPVVIDPAHGSGPLLEAVADRFGDRVHAVGRSPLGTAAGAVCVPPLDPPKRASERADAGTSWEFGVPTGRDSELAWVQQCYAYLRPHGVAIVAVSARTCFQTSGQQIRAALVRSGVLRDVIALPKGMGPSPDTEFCLWVLRRPYGTPDYAPVRMVNLSGVADQRDLPYQHAAWQQLFTDTSPEISRAVERVELLDGDTNLLPSRHVVARVDADAEDIASMTRRLQDLYAQVGQGLPRFAAPDSAPRHSTVTIAELERVGALTIRTRETTPRAGDVLIRTLGRPPIVATGAQSDEVGVSQVIEVDPARMDSYFVATFLQADANTLPTSNTIGVLSRDDLRRCRIPRLPPAEQGRYGAAFQQLLELRDALSALAAVSASVIDQTLHALTIGALAPKALPINKTDNINSNRR